MQQKKAHHSGKPSVFLCHLYTPHSPPKLFASTMVMMMYRCYSHISFKYSAKIRLHIGNAKHLRKKNLVLVPICLWVLDLAPIRSEKSL